MNRFWQVLFQLLFWGGNLWFSLWSVFGFLPLVVLEIFEGAWEGILPWSFFAFGLGLVVLPPLGLVVGLHPRFRRDPGRLMALMYGVEVPLILLLAFRTFAVQQLGPATGLALVLVGTGAVALLRTLWTGGPERHPAAQLVQLIGQTGYLVVGGWFASVAALYGIPVAIEVLDVPWSEIELAYIPLAAIFVMGTVAFLGVGCFAAGLAAVRTFAMVWRASTERFGRRWATGIVVATVGAWIGLFSWASVQPHRAAFAELDGIRSDADRRAALEHSESLREGLLFGRLIRERTFEEDPYGLELQQIWERNVGPRGADASHAFWLLLFSPFVHQPYEDGNARVGRDWNAPADVTRASELYGEFFDAPIEVAEREALLEATRQTWDWQSAAAGLLDIGQRKVHLARQDIEVVSHGDLARVTVHEVYRNRTWERQEVFVYFSLPESAAITGLWLSHDETRRFEYVVAPRGAAQEVYESQVRISRDPALLEQVGPRQYRLRAFPIEARSGSPIGHGPKSPEGPNFHLWLEVVVPSVSTADGEPFFPLPVATEVRNLFWDEDTVRELDGASLEVDAWLPDRVVAPEPARTHSVRLGDHLVEASPAEATSAAPLGNVAVLVDSTRSMDRQRDAVAASLHELRGAASSLEIYCTREAVVVRCDDYEPREALMWGAAALEHRLAELATSLDDVDALVVLTDAGSYTLAAAAERAGLPDVELPPLWLVHLGGDPQAYPDWTLDRLSRSGGGVAGSVEDVLVRIADRNVIDGRRWSVSLADPNVELADPDDPFAALAARRLVAVLDAEGRTSGIESIDRLHEVAVGYHVVTAYSSMLVLVEDAQRRELEAASAREDRFDREVIDAEGGETVTSVPEPATLVMLGVGGLMAYRRRRNRRASEAPERPNSPA